MTFRGCNHRSYSVFFQDSVMLSLLSFALPNASTYIELASNDAVANSNTFYMDRCLNWQGLCIQQNPLNRSGFAQRSCKLERKCVLSHTERRTFQFEDEVGHLTDERRFRGNKCVRFDELVTKHSLADIGYLSLDVGGHELQAMKTWSWNRHVINAMTVQNAKKPFVEYMARRGMYVLQCVSLDIILVNERIYKRSFKWLNSLDDATRTRWCLRPPPDCIDSTVSLQACQEIRK